MFSGLFTMIMVMVVVSIIVSITSRRSAPPPHQMHRLERPLRAPAARIPAAHPVSRSPTPTHSRSIRSAPARGRPWTQTSPPSAASCETWTWTWWAENSTPAPRPTTRGHWTPMTAPRTNWSALRPTPMCDASRRSSRTARFAVASVKARVNGHPLPEKRPPCFFDPAHGPSTQNVHWAPPGGAVRDVPACAADAQRVMTGLDPSIRLVPMGASQVPYWENQQYAPWAQGYYGRYGMDPALRQITHGALMIGGFRSMGCSTTGRRPAR